jgi:hypothetical protein
MADDNTVGREYPTTLLKIDSILIGDLRNEWDKVLNEYDRNYIEKMHPKLAQLLYKL